jgi:hypothetical protein
MKIKENRDNVLITWDSKSKEDIDKAIEQYYIYIRKGWWPRGAYSNSLTNSQYGTMPRSFFKNYNQVDFVDYLSSELAIHTPLDELICMLTDWGFSPCLSTRGIGKKAYYRFHVDRARNFWADHKNAYTAAVNAIKLWKKAGRPLFEPLDTGNAPSEEPPPFDASQLMTAIQKYLELHSDLGEAGIKILMTGMVETLDASLKKSGAWK